MLQMFRPILSYNRNFSLIYKENKTLIIGRKRSHHVSLLFCWENDVGSYRSDDVNTETDQNRSVSVVVVQEGENI